MPARHFSSVDLPEPLRPTMPKNSPGCTAKETPRKAAKVSLPPPRRGWSTRSLSVLTCSRGISKLLWTPSTTTGCSAWLVIAQQAYPCWERRRSSSAFDLPAAQCQGAPVESQCAGAAAAGMEVDHPRLARRGESLRPCAALPLDHRLLARPGFQEALLALRRLEPCQSRGGLGAEGTPGQCELVPPLVRKLHVDADLARGAEGIEGERAGMREVEGQTWLLDCLPEGTQPRLAVG